MPLGGAAFPLAFGSSGSWFANPHFQGHLRMFNSSSVNYSPASFLYCNKKNCHDFFAFSAHPGSASSQDFLRAASFSSFSVSLTTATVSDAQTLIHHQMFWVSSSLGLVQFYQAGMLNWALITYLCLYSLPSWAPSFGFSTNPALDFNKMWEIEIWLNPSYF